MYAELSVRKHVTLCFSPFNKGYSSGLDLLSLLLIFSFSSSICCQSYGGLRTVLLWAGGDVCLYTPVRVLPTMLSGLHDPLLLRLWWPLNLNPRTASSPALLDELLCVCRLNRHDHIAMKRRISAGLDTRFLTFCVPPLPLF